MRSSDLSHRHSGSGGDSTESAQGQGQSHGHNFGCAPPAWTPYDASALCACCRCPFTWHSTFQGEAQEYRERYNCRHCGGLVCGPCSLKRRAIPRLGLIQPSRICDRCFHKVYALDGNNYLLANISLINFSSHVVYITSHREIMLTFNRIFRRVKDDCGDPESFCPYMACTAVDRDTAHNVHTVS